MPQNVFINFGMNNRILKVRWSKKENDFLITYPRKCDGALMNYILGDILKWGGIDGKDKGWLNYKVFNLIEEFKKRGYDTKTLKFEIKLFDEEINEKEI